MMDVRRHFVIGSWYAIIRNMTKKREVVVLIPCYNEEKTIAKVVKDFLNELPGAKIFVFDNNSSDKSAELAKKAGAIVKKVSYQGKGNVVREMFRQVEADIYLMVDGDDTYDARDAKKIVAMVEDGADMVIGDRLNSTYFKENKRFGHNFGNVLVRKLINLFFRSNIQDVMTGYRGFSRRFVKTCPILSKGFQVETEMTVHALDKKMCVVSAPIGYKDRPADSPSKLNTYRDGVKVMATIFNLVKEYKPLMFFSVLALIVLIIAIILGVPVLIEYFATGLVERFPSLIVAGLLVMMSFLSFATGLILDIILKKSRQQFEISLNVISEARK